MNRYATLAVQGVSHTVGEAPVCSLQDQDSGVARHVDDVKPGEKDPVLCAGLCLEPGKPGGGSPFSEWPAPAFLR